MSRSTFDGTKNLVVYQKTTKLKVRAGSFLDKRWVPIINPQYTARTNIWINYLWYNQQRFINWTIAALRAVHAQSHATSLMALQIRLIIYRLLAEDQEVCTYIGEQCCTVFPMHTNKEGNLTKIYRHCQMNMYEIIIGTLVCRHYGTGLNICPGKRSYKC